MKTVFFIHAHKCAGTAIVNLFSRHDHVKLIDAWKRHNGKPKYFRELKRLDDYNQFFLDYDAGGLERFFRRMERRGVNFVATEWAVPPVESLPFNSDHFYFTVLRDPLQRYLSNYYFDIDKGYRRVSSIYDYPDGRMFREPDYYTRLFSSRLEKDSRPTTEDDFEQALSLLQKLDAVIIQEQPETFNVLRQLGIDPGRMERRNVAKKTVRSLPKGFPTHFAERARFDYLLYDEAKKLAAADRARRS